MIISTHITIKISLSSPSLSSNQHHITMIISNPHDHHDITIIPSLSSTATPYHHDHIQPTRPSRYHHHPHPYHLQQHHIPVIISHPHDHQDITIILIPIIYSNTISPWSYPTHMTIKISPSSPSISSTPTPYHHDHIQPTWPSRYHYHPHPYHLTNTISPWSYPTHTTITISPSFHPYHLQQHHITMIISNPHDHHDITIIPSLSTTATPYPRDHIPPTWPSRYHYHPHPYHLQQHHITMIISNPHDHQDITIIPIPINYINTISPWSYPTHMTITISPSSPSRSTTATPYHHDHIPPTRLSRYHHHPHPYNLQQHHITMIISHSHDHQYIAIIPIPIIYSNTIAPWSNPPTRP